MCKFFSPFFCDPLPELKTQASKGFFVINSAIYKPFSAGGGGGGGGGGAGARLA